MLLNSPREMFAPVEEADAGRKGDKEFGFLYFRVEWSMSG